MPVRNNSCQKIKYINESFNFSHTFLQQRNKECGILVLFFFFFLLVLQFRFT